MVAGRDGGSAVAKKDDGGALFFWVNVCTPVVRWVSVLTKPQSEDPNLIVFA